MMDLDLTSIIIPCYNQARFLGEAIESALAQTYSYCEVIVVDDGSTDNSATIAASFDRAHCLRQKNRGLGEARNAGLEVSRGDYIVFLDADDRLLPNALQDCVNSLKANPECAFVYGHVKLIGSDGSPLPTPNQVGVCDDHYLELLRHNYIWTAGAVMYRRKALESVGRFNPLANGSADFGLNILIARLSPICCSNTPVVEYRRHDESMSRDYALMLKSAVTVRRGHRKFAQGSEVHKEALETGIRSVQEDYGEKLMHVVGDRLRERNWRKAISGLTTLLRHYPRGLVKRIRRSLNSIALSLQNSWNSTKHP